MHQKISNVLKPVTLLFSDDLTLRITPYNMVYDYPNLKRVRGNLM